MQIFATSDSHFSHENIIGYCNRPFASLEEMDEVLVERWNKVVRPQDHVYNLGDVAMKRPHLSIVKRLNGHKRLVMGNHDIFHVKDYLDAGFEKVMAMRVFGFAGDDDKRKFILSHVPIHPESMGRFLANVHGHIHNHPGYGFPYINVSVEVTDYTPVSLDDLRSRIAVEHQAAGVVL